MAELELAGGVKVEIDEEDLAKLGEYWVHAVVRKVYVMCVAKAGRRARPLAHVVLGVELERGQVVDHINGDALDCRKGNLRVCTRAQNNYNTGARKGRRYRGIYEYRRADGERRWRVEMRRGAERWRRTFASEAEAVREYNAKAREMFGEYARLNEEPEVASSQPPGHGPAGPGESGERQIRR